MHKEKVFTNPHISQMLIAKELNTNRVYVSRLVNGVFKMTYSNYISYCRIWEFVRLANYDLTASFRSEYLAIQSGFSRRASFYEAFKKKMGITPAKWIKNGKPDLRHLFPPTIKMFIE
jgi:AraC-like DNA-binding protein